MKGRGQPTTPCSTAPTARLAAAAIVPRPLCGYPCRELFRDGCAHKHSPLAWWWPPPPRQGGPGPPFKIRSGDRGSPQSSRPTRPVALGPPIADSVLLDGEPRSRANGACGAILGPANPGLRLLMSFLPRWTLPARQRARGGFSRSAPRLNASGQAVTGGFPGPRAIPDR